MTKNKKVLIIIASVLAILILVISLLFVFDIAQKEIIRLLCTDQSKSFPANYETLKTDTTIETFKYSDSYSLDIITPKVIEPNSPIFVYFHGGYYVGGGRHNQEPYCLLLSSKGYIVVNADYRLAPESPFPAQLIDVNNVLKFIETKYPDNNGYVISGDSAGANLAGQYSLLVNMPEFAKAINVVPQISSSQLLGFVGNCGLYDIKSAASTNFPLIDSAMRMFMGHRDYKNMEVMKYLNLMDNASLLPPTMLICGDKDPFIKQNKQLEQSLKASKVPVSVYFPTSSENQLMHEFQSNYSVKESYISLDLTVEFLKSLTA